VADATIGVVEALPFSPATSSLHAFFTSLNELPLLAAIRFLMQSITWTT
jgi:hypothetical protein